MDGNNLSGSQLKFGYWFVTHKILLRNILIVILLVANVLLWGYILFNLILSYGIQYTSFQQMIADLSRNRFVNYAGIQEVTQPRDMQVTNIMTLPSEGGRIDILARVTNPNANWGATFSYQFQAAGGTTEPRNGFILPGQSKVLFDLDVEATQVTNLIFSNIEWQRENGIAEILQTRELFSVTDAQYLPPQAEDVGVSRTTFTVTNNSTYGYFNPQFQVYLYTGGEIVAVQNVATDTLRSLQTKSFDVRWVERLPARIDRVEVVPDINYLDPNAYL